MRKPKILALAAVLALAVLLALLLLAESAAPNATIVSVPSALWYLLATLTTVGYGDCYPVTAAGKLIGAVFQLMSLGLLGLLAGMLAVFLRGTAWERLRLAGLSGKKWYIFSELNEAGRCLAEALGREDGTRVLLFAGTRGDPGVGKASLLSAEALCARKKDGDFCLFCLSEDEGENERLADQIRTGQVYCRSGILPGKLPENQRRFDPVALCARRYWDRFPLLSKNEKILLIGDGALAEAILEQGLLRNVVDPAQHVGYFCAGDWSEFFRLHPELDQLLELDPALGGRDTLTVLAHWDEDPALLRQADRIVFCWEDEERTRRELGRLRRYFAVSGTVQARLSAPMEGADCFGGAADLYTPELVMQEARSALARALHRRYRQDHPEAAPWEALSDFTRRSNLAAADHLRVKLGLLAQEEGELPSPGEALERYRAAASAEKERFRRIEHARWRRFHILYGWRWAETRDNAKRLHPLLVPFDRLSPEAQRQQDDSWELLAVMGGNSHEN